MNFDTLKRSSTGWRYLLLWLAIFASSANASAEDATKLLPPSGKTCLFIPLTGYTASEMQVSQGHQIPLFKPFDVNDDWWDNIVAEQLQARVPVTMAFTRGADKPGDRSVLTGVGNMNPYRLTGLIDAFKRADVTPEIMRVGCFSDSAPYRVYQKRLYRDVWEMADGRFDWAHRPSWETVLWKSTFEPFFDTIPSNYWFRVGPRNRPLIRIWGLNEAANINHQGNLSLALAHVADQFESRFKERPIFTISQGDRRRDTTLIGHPDLYGFGNWFNLDQQDAFVFSAYNGVILGGGCPGYHGPSETPRILPRRDGKTLRWGLEEAMRLNASHTIIEGWKNSHEGAAMFRSQDKDWPTPNTYINIFRRYTDPDTPTIRLEAEGCDSYVDHSRGNSGGKFRRMGDLDVYDMPDGNGWCVANIEKGEVITHQKVYFSQGQYRIYLRYSASEGGRVLPTFASRTLKSATLPATRSSRNFETTAIGEADIHRNGDHNLKLKFRTGQLQVDWIFVRRVSPSGNPAK